MIDEQAINAAKEIFAATQPSFLKDVTGKSGDDVSTASLATVETGKDYLIVQFDSQAGKTEVKIDGAVQKRDANVIWLDLVEESTGLAARIYLGTLKRNMSAAQKAGLLGKYGVVKAALTGKRLRMRSYANKGRDANDRAIIELDYSIE